MERLGYFKDKLTYKMISKLFKKSHDLYISSDVRAEDPATVIPGWFLLLEKLKWFQEFTKNRRSERDYTLPLPSLLHDMHYNRPLTLTERNRILTIMQRSNNVAETTIMLRLRREKFLNQLRKKQLYSIAASNSANVYTDLYDYGFGFEFNLLSIAYSAGEIDAAIVSMKDKLSEIVRLDSIFRRMLRDLRSTFVVCYVVFIALYLGTVYVTYIMPGTEFTFILPVFRPGLTVVTSLMSGNYSQAILFVFLNICIGAIFKFFQLGDVLLLAIPTTRDILLFFENLKFLTTLDMMQSLEDTTEYTLFKKTIASLEIKPMAAFLQKKLDEVRDVPDIIQGFLLSSSFMDETDVNHLIDINSPANRLTFSTNVKELIEQKRFEAKTRESSDQEKIIVFRDLMLNTMTVLGVLMFTVGDLQIFNAVI